MEPNKRFLVRLLEEAKGGSPGGGCRYSRNFFLFTSPHALQAFHERETGEKVSSGDAELHAYLCVEAGYVHIPPEDGDDNDDLLPAQKLLRLTLQGYEKLESLKKELG